MVSSGMVGRGLRLRIPDVSPASSEVAASTVVSEVMEVGCFLRTYSAWDLPAAMSSRSLIGGCPAWALIG